MELAPGDGRLLPRDDLRKMTPVRRRRRSGGELRIGTGAVTVPEEAPAPESPREPAAARGRRHEPAGRRAMSRTSRARARPARRGPSPGERREAPPRRSSSRWNMAPPAARAPGTPARPGPRGPPRPPGPPARATRRGPRAGRARWARSGTPPRRFPTGGPKATSPESGELIEPLAAVSPARAREESPAPTRRPGRRSRRAAGRPRGLRAAPRAAAARPRAARRRGKRRKSAAVTGSISFRRRSSV
jgi:hypothetical protein